MRKDLVSSGRVYVLIAVMGLWGTVIGARLFYLQVVQSADFRERADRQQKKTIPIVPPRGSILDRNWNPLAVSVQVKSVYGVHAKVEDIQATSKVLSSI